MDHELADLRARVDCRTVLERAGWQLDRAESSLNAPKYRNGADIVIVTNQGKGWFDPLNDARGDVVALAQHIYGGTIGHARKALRPLAGMTPQMVAGMQRDKAAQDTLDAVKVWSKAARLKPGAQGWRYLNEVRNLPASSLAVAVEANVVREGIYGTVWFLHRQISDRPCGWEMRGPKYKGFSKGGEKAVFSIGNVNGADRLVIVESAIDALSLATLEEWPRKTAYISTGGGFGPNTADTIVGLVPPGIRLVAATDRGAGGELLAERLHEIASHSEVGFGRLRPDAKDWNAQLAEG